MIRIYTTNKCKYCKQVKDYFISRNILFKEIDMRIGGNQETIEMKKKFKSIGLKTYPVIVVNRKDGREFIFSEFDEKTLEKVIKHDRE